MSRTLVLIGTRKGCFVLESDADRRDWSVRGPFCESWPVYHAVYDQGSGTIYAAAASEWHGSAIWRSRDLGETWALSSEGLAYGEDGRASFEGLDARRRARPRARRRRGAGHLREPRRRRDLVAPLDARRPAGQRGLGRPGEPAARATSASRRSMLDPDDRVALLGDRAGHRRSSRRPTAAATWTPRNRGLRADWPREHEEVGFCVHKLVRSPTTRADVPAEPRRHAPHRRRRRTRGPRSPRACRPSSASRAAVAPARPRHVLRDPARPGPRPHDARRRGGGLAHARRRLELAALDDGPAAERRAPRRAARGRWRTTRYDVPGLLLRHEHRPGVRERRRGRAAGARSRATCRRSRPSRSAVIDCDGRRAPADDADAALPGPAAPPRGRRGDGRRGDRRSSTSAGRACATGSASRAPAIRPHIHVYVDRRARGARHAARSRARAST